MIRCVACRAQACRFKWHAIMPSTVAPPLQQNTLRLVHLRSDPVLSRSSRSLGTGLQPVAAHASARSKACGKRTRITCVSVSGTLQPHLDASTPVAHTLLTSRNTHKHQHTHLWHLTCMRMHWGSAADMAAACGTHLA